MSSPSVTKRRDEVDVRHELLRRVELAARKVVGHAPVAVRAVHSAPVRRHPEDLAALASEDLSHDASTPPIERRISSCGSV